ERREGAEGRDVAVGEVQDPGRLVDEDDPERDQRVEAAGGEARDRVLEEAVHQRKGHCSSATRALRSAPARPPGSKTRTRMMEAPNSTGTAQRAAPNAAGARTTKAAPRIEPSIEARPPTVMATKSVSTSPRLNSSGSRWPRNWAKRAPWMPV